MTSPTDPAGTGPFRYCLNTSTIHGQVLSLVEEIAVTAEAGYQGIEPWIRELDAYVESGGDLDELSRRIEDQGLSVENAIGFFEWVVDDDALRAKGLEEARRNMEMASRIGCRRLAAPPYGATDVCGLDLDRAAERYRELLELGERCGVTPMLEFWGHSHSLGRLSEALYVAAESGRRDACVLADVFHMFKGGSPYEGLRLVGPDTIALLHVNDFPGGLTREGATDAERVYPGDGVAPLAAIFRDLYDVGFRGPLSVELFNEDYWRQEPLEVARTGLAKLRASVEAALSI